MVSLLRRRVMVVEDEAAISLELVRLLREQGAMVVGPASSAEEALQHIARTHIHCALLDIKLCGGDCGAVAQALTWHGIPFIFVTGYSKSEVAARYSWVPVVTKPYTPNDILNRVKSVFATSPSPPRTKQRSLEC